MTVFITLPAFNEEDALPSLLDKVAECRKDWNADLKVLVIDDGSSDGTVRVSKAHPLAFEGMLEVVAHEKNLGLAAAVRTAVDAFLERSDSDDDVMVTMDADDTHDPAYTAVLLKDIRDGAGVAICSRFVAGGHERGVTPFRRLLSRGAMLFMALLAPVKGVKDISCGYRAYSKKAVEKARRVYGAHLVQSRGGSVQAELLVKIAELGERITEVPFTLRYDLKSGPSKLGMWKTIRGYFPLRGIQKLSRVESEMMMGALEKPPDASGVLVMTCTYNERENIGPLVRDVFRVLPGASMLVVDDSSPDGTGDAVRELEPEYPRLHLLSRSGKLGLASAIVDGFRWGKEQGFKAVINMDADFSHDPVSLPEFIRKGEGADYVVGSRYIAGGCTLNWGIHRKILSRGGNTFARALLGVPIHDMTTGYRLVKTDRMDGFGFDTIDAKGYGFLIVMTFRAVKAGMRIAEVPIRFLDRQYGASKMSANIISEAFKLVLKLRGERKR